MSEPLPLAATSVRLRGQPGRPRKVRETAPAPSPLVDQVRRRLLDVEAAAAYLSCSPWTVRDLEAAGVLTRVRIPLPSGGELRKLLFDVLDVDALIASWKDPS